MENFAYVKEFDTPLEKSKEYRENVNIRPIVETVKIYSFEEAVALTGTGIFHYFLQIVCGICLMAAVVEVMGISMVMPFINRDIPSTSAQKGFLASASFLGTVLSSHAVGFLSDTWGRAKMLRTTLTLSFVTSAISAFSVNIWMLIAFKFLTGFIISACQGCVFSFVGEFHSSRTRTKYITMFSMFMPIGIMVMPALAIGILPLKLDVTLFGQKFESWRLLLLVFSFLRVFGIIGLFMTPETPKYQLMQGNHEQALKTLRMMFSKNKRKPECEYPVQQVSIEMSGRNLNNISGIKDGIMLVWKQTSPLFNKKRILHTTNICVSMFTISAIGQGTFMWFPTILKEKVALADGDYTTCEIMQLARNASENNTALEGSPDDIPIDTSMFVILIIIGAAFSITYFICSLVIDFIGKRKLLIVWVLISGSSCLVLQYVTNFEWSLVVFTLITSINNCTGIISTVAMEFFPMNVSAMGMCLMMMIARLGSVAGSNFVGLMLYIHCDIMFYIYFALCLLVGVLSLFLPRAVQILKK